ncbi:YsnF/AvaK domain-containing protein, partial [Clavibacter zhangzhiyongii]|uniref:YsnF/AvaK domain-containing protein n=1 Tax=Clavibacter zhangzhiyongii TaxID=2768071 RepID=UPI00195825B6
FGTSESFVPLQEATWDRESLVVGYDKAKVKDAPRVESDGALSEEEEDSLYSYYGIGSGSASTTTAGAGTSGLHDQDDRAGVVGDRDVDADRDRDRDGIVGHDTSGPTTDDAMTRSEEQLHVGTERRETGRARLRKHVVTEEQTVTVPVSHEEVRLEREPITDANVGAATSGPDLSDEEHEVVLTEERPVVEKETVPVERVKLGTETVTDEERVTEDVRHEE